MQADEEYLLSSSNSPPANLMGVTSRSSILRGLRQLLSVTRGTLLYSMNSGWAMIAMSMLHDPSHILLVCRRSYNNNLDQHVSTSTR